MKNTDSHILRNPQQSELLDLLAPFMNCEPAFAESSGDRCLDRGLLPAHLLTCLTVLKFVSITVLAAQEAQRGYGVWASVLLSMAIDESSFDVCALTPDRLIFKERGCSRELNPSIGRWFSARAKRLTRTDRLKIAAREPSAKRHIDHLCRLGFCDRAKADDLWANIETYELQRCDLAGMLPIGEYYRWEYDPVTDEDGNVISLKTSEFQALSRAFRTGTFGA